MYTNRSTFNRSQFNGLYITTDSGGGIAYLDLDLESTAFKSFSREGGVLYIEDSLFSDGIKSMLHAATLIIVLDTQAGIIIHPLSRDNQAILDTMRTAKRPEPSKIKEILLNDIDEEKIVRVLREEAKDDLEIIDLSGGD